ncbi:hypothetical protein E2C01_082739 [Portunus trituberculatus]|uniref:Uncharacterized protein n=1 Tax=Portunus trituberculatus TaxID=210409 RepID=A0A5B7IT47_PORTR|nr:hypothetical protein [Portunus trituberculatus]
MYASPVWSSSLTCAQQQQLENVQKKGPAESYFALPTLTMITPYLPSISPHWQPDTKRPSSRWVEACCATLGYGISSP